MCGKMRRVTMATFLAAGDVTAFPSVAEALAAAVGGAATPIPARGWPSTRATRGAPGALRDIANPGQTLVSAAAAAAAPEGTALADLGLHRLRDLSPPLRVFALGDATPPRSLDATPNNLPSRPTTFVGREAELAELHVRVAGDAAADRRRARAAAGRRG